jgi:TetR/AcrR family transcriptional repressor of nem operon
MPRTRDAGETRNRLLDAARDVIRAKGYSATTIDDICQAAGVTKGAFFHHFESKERLGVAAVEQFEARASALFGSAPYAADPDPRARVLGYVDFRASMLQGDIARYTCLMGTTVQEVYATHPELRAACDQGMSEHVAELTRDIEAAKRRYAPDAAWSAESVGYFMQSVLQGAFIFAKAKQSPDVALESLRHLRRYLEILLGEPPIAGPMEATQQASRPARRRRLDAHAQTDRQ